MKLLISVLLTLMLAKECSGGILTAIAAYGICQSGCNAAWVACVAAAGGVAGVSTGGTAVPAAILACNVLQGVCMTACAAMTSACAAAPAL